MNAITRKIRTLYRSAVTGRFVKKVYALLHPKQTTKEEIK